MKKFAAFFAAATLTSAFGVTAFATTPDVYVVNFRNEKNTESQSLDRHLNAALTMVGNNVEQVVIDTTTAARWEKGAHEAFDREIVPLFNKWVGLPGFAAIVDAKSKRVLGCVNSQFNASEMARELQRMSAQAKGSAYMSNASTSGKTTACPPAYNTPPS